MDADLKSPKRLLRLTCSVQNYDWGLAGADSLVAKLYGLNSGKEIELDKPYAEFWMGTHGSGPSFVVKKTGAFENGAANGGCCGGETTGFKSWILKNPNVLGDKVLNNWGCDLPFLFKVCFLIFVSHVFEFLFIYFLVSCELFNMGVSVFG